MAGDPGVAERAVAERSAIGASQGPLYCARQRPCQVRPIADSGAVVASPPLSTLVVISLDGGRDFARSAHVRSLPDEPDVTGFGAHDDRIEPQITAAVVPRQLPVVV